ncbi:MAG: DUF4912 domain-containing protein [Planctomycetota bacterium]
MEPNRSTGEPVNALRVMVRDPSWLFVYWDLSPARHETAPREARWVLRVIRKNEGRARDIEIDLGSRNWYVPVQSASTYEAEIGYHLPDGTYHTVIRGNTVETPSRGTSPIIDPEWFVSVDEFQRLYAPRDFLSATSPGKGFSEAEGWAFRHWPLSPLASSHDAQKKPR